MASLRLVSSNFMFMFIRFVLISLLVAASWAQVKDPATGCKRCFSDQCPEENNCRLLCENECPVGYYISRDAAGFVCHSPTTPTTPTTATTPTIATAVSNNKDVSANASNSSASRRRRQASNSTTPAPATTPTTTTTATTLPPPEYVCALCDLKNCSVCKNFSTSECEICDTGYRLDNETKTCIDDSGDDEEDELPIGIIVGSVVGGIAFIAILAVIIVCVVRRYTGSAKMEKRELTPMGETRRGDGSVENPSSPFPKFDTEDMQRTHDKITRYTRDPTAKNALEGQYSRGRSDSHEAKELEELGEAPPPPAAEGGKTYVDMKQSYDSLAVHDPDEPEFYTGLEAPTQGAPTQDDVYVNTAAIEAQVAVDNIYANTGAPQEVYYNEQANGGPLPTASDPATSSAALPTHKTTDYDSTAAHRHYLNQPQESQETYEVVGNNLVHEEPQEIYMNEDPAGSSNAQEVEEPQEIYMNEDHHDPEDVYENTQS